MPEQAPQQLVGFAITVVILTGGLIALALWLGKSRLKDRILLWFGLFALVYSTRELAENGLVVITFHWPQQACDLFVSWMDFSIVIPALLFLEEVFGRGWRSSLRWAIWLLTAYAGLGIVLGLAAGRPYVIPEPGSWILGFVLAAVYVVNRVNHYQRPAFSDRRIVFLGFAVFAMFVLSQHLVPDFHSEQVGFFALICALGIVAVRRMLRNEGKLLDMEQELAAARRIQASILPGEAPAVRALKIVTRYSPMTSVAGDFYDFAALDSECAGILIADVAGHGVPAALIASMVKVAFAAQQPHAGHPGRVLAGLNKTFCSQLRGQYVTAAYLVINGQEGTATYSGAGHPPLMVWRASTRQVERFEDNGLFLGFRANETYPEVGIKISDGDRLILYTDGLLEASNAAGENFGDCLDERMERYRDLSAAAFADALLADLRAWRPRSRSASTLHEQDDDLTLIVVDVEQTPSPAAVPNRIEPANFTYNS